MNRRSFILTSAAFVGSSALLQIGCGRQVAASQMIQPGVQLYTLRNVMAENPEAVLEQLTSIGYTEVETHTYYGMAPTDFRAMLDRVGLAAPCAHVGADQLQQDLDGVIEAAGIIGHRYVICPHPGPLPYETLDDYRAMGEYFSDVGARFAEAGMRFGYHNHDFEFTPIDGKIPLYVLMDSADTDDVVLELDLFWAVHGGVDPVNVIERYPGRVQAFHVKDRTPSGEMADVGDGTIDFARIFQHSEQAGLRHAFVEHDDPQDPLQSVQNSHAHLTQLLGA